MITVHLSSLEEFETQFATIIDARKEITSNRLGGVPGFLFRGHSNAQWKLETTLERTHPDPMAVAEYYDIIFDFHHEIEIYAKQKWNIPTPPKYTKWLEKKKGFGFFDFPAYDYMVYLRHHGFPSPPLDWSRSPYVAAFFAFRHALDKQPVAIYAYLEYGAEVKYASTTQARITTRGPIVRGHQRHFSQQSAYSICTDQPRDRGRRYARHEDVVARNDRSQDLIWKFCIPSRERTKVLGQLDLYNLNAFSLIGSEDALMEALSFRVFKRRNAPL